MNAIGNVSSGLKHDASPQFVNHFLLQIKVGEGIPVCAKYLLGDYIWSLVKILMWMFIGSF